MELTQQNADVSKPNAVEKYDRPKPGLVDKRVVAQFLGFSTRYVEQLMAKRGLPYMAFGRRRCRFDLDEVARWAKTNQGVNYSAPFSQN